MTTKDLLKALLVRHRELAKPHDSPYRQGVRPGPKPSGISAERFGKDLGVSKSIYLKIENGERKPTVDQVERIAALLQMTWRARAALVRRALQCEPAVAPDYPAGAAAVAVRQALLAPHPACVTDLAYNIYSHNSLFAALLPHAATQGPPGPRPNLMRATLLHQWAGNSPEWMEELTAELIESVALYADNAQLQQLHAEVSADPLAGPVYANAPKYVYPDRECKLLLSHTFAGLGVRHLFFVSE